MNMVDGLVAAYVAFGANRGRRRGLAEEVYRLLRVSLAMVAGCGLYSLVGDLVGKVLSLGADISGPVGFVGSMLGAWSLLRLLKARLVDWGSLRFHSFIEVGGAIAGGLRALVLALAAMLTAHLAGRSAFMADSVLGKVIGFMAGN